MTLLYLKSRITEKNGKKERTHFHLGHPNPIFCISMDPLNPLDRKKRGEFRNDIALFEIENNGKEREKRKNTFSFGPSKSHILHFDGSIESIGQEKKR